MKKRNSQHSFAFVLLAGMLCFLVSGCRDLKKENKPESQSTAYASSSIFLAEPKSVQYPMEEATMQLSVMIPQEGEQCEKQPVYSQIEEQTGVELSYQIVPQAEYADAVLAVLDSQNIPDLIYGIPDAMLQAQLDPDTSEPLLILNAYIKTEAPNYIQAVRQEPERQHRAVGEDGTALSFLTFYDTPYRFADAGPVIRSDLLEQYGMKKPETYDEWTDTLRKLKNDVQAPLLLTTVEFRYWDYLSAGMGISMALEHLAELGHRSVGFIGPEWKLDDLGRRAPEVRRQLFSQQLEARGLECRDWLLDCPMETEAAARAVGERLSNGGTRPTALLAANEETAIGAIRALRLAGLDAPKDLSVVSFNDTPRSALVEPPLTSVSAHVEEMARTALRLLRERVALPGREPERTVPLKVVVPSSLTVRSSTGPVPAE